jgi:hypothetical protein
VGGRRLAELAGAELDATFGADPEPLEVALTLPAGSTGLEVTYTCQKDFADPAYSDDRRCPGPLAPQTVGGAAPAIRFDPDPYYPGTYTVSAHVVASYDVGYGNQVRTRDFSVRYTIDGSSGPALILWQRATYADPVRYFAPEEGFAFEIADTLSHELLVGGYPRSGVLVWAGGDFSLSVPPPGADLQAPYSDWLSFYPWMSAWACVWIGTVTHCMEPGTYGAVLDARVDAGGASTHFAVPVTMTVLPRP